MLPLVLQDLSTIRSSSLGTIDVRETVVVQTVLAGHLRLAVGRGALEIVGHRLVHEGSIILDE